MRDTKDSALLALAKHLAVRSISKELELKVEKNRRLKDSHRPKLASEWKSLREAFGITTHISPEDALTQIIKVLYES